MRLFFNVQYIIGINSKESIRQDVLSSQETDAYTRVESNGGRDDLSKTASTSKLL